MNRELVAIYFIWKREVIRFFRSKSRVIGSLGMPFFFLAILGTGLNSTMRFSGANGNYLEFITPGVLAMVLLLPSISSGIMVIVDRQFGFLKETLIAPVRRTSIVCGKSIGGATTALFQGILMLMLSIFLGTSINVANLPLALLLMTIISMAFVSLGIAVACVIDDTHGFQLVMNFLIMPLFFLSGALFPLSSAPNLVRYISYLDPLTYAVEALRFLLVGEASMPFQLSVCVLVLFFSLTSLAAAYLFNRIEN
jgi:ABC-2 type transport system permease protein